MAATRRSHTTSAEFSGLLLVATATLAWSLSGVFARLLSTDVCTAVAWRSFFGGLFLAVALVAIHRGRSMRMLGQVGRCGLLLAAAQVVCQACTVGALMLTTVANVTLIYATAPFLAAGLAWVLLGEKVERRTVAASLASLAGTAIILAGSAGSSNLLGDVLALGMTVSFALVIVLPRAKPDLPTLPATILSAVATVALFAPLSAPATLDAGNWLVLAAFGFTSFTLALFLFIAGARRIPSAQAALVGTLELALAPLWVWAAFGEMPSAAALAGGAVNAAAVFTHTILDVREERRLRAAGGPASAMTT